MSTTTFVFLTVLSVAAAVPLAEGVGFTVTCALLVVTNCFDRLIWAIKDSKHE